MTRPPLTCHSACVHVGNTAGPRDYLPGLPGGYGGRLVSKLHSDAFAKLEHVLLSFEYAFFIRVWCLHLGMLFSFGYGLAFGYALFIQVWSLHLGMLFSFGYGLCIWVCSLHLSVIFSFGYGIFIWIYVLFSFGYGLFIWIYYSFCICVKPFNRSPH